MTSFLIGVLMVGLTVVIFFWMRRIYLKKPNPFLLPVITTTFILFVLLVASGTSYETYMIGGAWLNELMGPAIVALAYPLYIKRHVVIKFSVMISAGVASGLMIGFGSIFALSTLSGVEQVFVASMLPKSITAPVAVELSAALNGIPPLTAVFVLIAGLTGILFGPTVMKWSRINSLNSKSIALGAASHAMGISKAAEYGDVPLSMSSIAMIVSAISASILLPIVLFFF
ncbi:CidA-associated membrane protein CidB [Bacillus sp. JCM 19045]|nr:CidA-associated membrane protein CidB [Bacillus sp. JCM 19045]